MSEIYEPDFGEETSMVMLRSVFHSRPCVGSTPKGASCLPLEDIQSTVYPDGRVWLSHNYRDLITVDSIDNLISELQQLRRVAAQRWGWKPRFEDLPGVTLTPTKPS